MTGKKSTSGFAKVFAPFVEETMKSFAYLVRDFGFEHSDTAIESRECEVTFLKNRRVAVIVECEAGGLPTVMLAAVIGEREVEADLDSVIRRRCPERQLDVPDEFPAPDEDVNRLLRHYAVVLRECAAEFLEGDPSVLQEIRRKASAKKKRAPKE